MYTYMYIYIHIDICKYMYISGVGVPDHLDKDGEAARSGDVRVCEVVFACIRVWGLGLVGGIFF